MKKIASFTVDHLRLLRGVYVSRVDRTPKGDVLTTFDVRMTEPNREEALAPATLHTIEHLAATYLRNHPEWGERIVYWGPMGCCTGNYLIVMGEYQPEDVVGLLHETFEFIAEYQGDIPGATPRDCGNYSFMDAGDARRVARRFLTEVLDGISEANMRYPS